MIVVIDNRSSFLPQIEAWLGQVPYDIKTRDEDWGDIGSCELVVLTGGHDYSVKNHQEFYKKELDLVRNFKGNAGRLVGICLGFELIALAFGSQLRHLAEKETGEIGISVVKDDPVFDHIKSMEVFESHQWAVESLGNELEILARSDEGIEAIRHKTKSIYGFQFHPEAVRDAAAGPILLSNLLGIAKKE